MVSKKKSKAAKKGKGKDVDVFVDPPIQASKWNYANEGDYFLYNDSDKTWKEYQGGEFAREYVELARNAATVVIYEIARGIYLRLESGRSYFNNTHVGQGIPREGWNFLSQGDFE